MYGNPYFNNFRENQQQPIQNIINTQMPLNNLFMAQFLKENEKVEEMFVNHKTAFIDLFKKELKIKDIDGTITTYGLILPKDEKIEALEKQIQELKGMIVNEQSNGNVYADNESTEQNGNGGKFNKAKSTTK